MRGDPPTGLGDRAARPRARRSALVAALLSCLVPGAGQVYAGRPRRGGLMLLAVLLLGAVAALAWRRLGTDLVELLVRPEVLLGLLVADAALLALRLLCVADAYRLGSWKSMQAGAGPLPQLGGHAPRRAQGRSRPGLGAAAAVTLIAVLTAAPHVAAGWYDFQAYTLLTSVFDSGPDTGAALGDTAPVDRPERPRTGPAPARGTTPAPSTASRPGRGRVTVLLLGADAGPGRSGLRTDTMVVVSVELATGRAALFGLPRNLTRVPLPDGPAAAAFPCRCFPDKLNALYRYAELHPELFPGAADPGATAVAGAAEALLGIPIDHWALVDLAGFVDVVDALGGVTVDVAEYVQDRLSPPEEGGAWQAFDIRPGRHHFDGRESLAYVRSRRGTDDYDRMRRQRCLLSALAGQASATSLLRALPRLVPVIDHSVSTDIPMKRLPTLVKLAKKARRDQAVAIGFAPPRYATKRSPADPPIPKVELIRATVRLALDRPEVLAGNGANETLGRSCG